MRIGFFSFWFNRGQACVTKEIRGVYRDAGHETFVLARPDKLQGRVRDDDVWAEPGVEKASAWDVPADELIEWARRHELDVCFFFQNDRFETIRAVRAAGITTVGAYMWEYFAPEHVVPSRDAYDLLYAFNDCDVRRYASLGLIVPRVRWGVWPRLLGREVPERGADEPVTFYYPAGYLEKRRAIEPTVRAFVKARAPNSRLLVKSVKPVPEERRVTHPNVIYRSDNLDRDEYLELLRSCDVCLSNTRWEGLGLVIYEAIAMGQPVISPDAPPMSENVLDGVTGVLVPTKERGTAPSGIPAVECNGRALAAAIRRVADRSEWRRMRRHQLALRDSQFEWSRTRDDLLRLLQRIRDVRESRA